MAFGAGSYHGLRFVVESTWGTTPGTPTMVSLRHKSCNLGLSKDTFQSGELRSDRMISDLRHGGRKVGGDIGIELSYKEYDPFLESALFGAWTTNVLKAGVIAKSFSVERAFTDISQYGVHSGCIVDKLSLSVKPNAIVEATLSLVGKDVSYSTSPLAASPTASQTYSPYDSFTGTITEGGSAIAIVTGIDLTLDNGLSSNRILGSNVPASLTPGRSNVTGTLSAYFQDMVLLNKFLNETTSSVQFVLGNGTAQSQTWLVPKVKYTGGLAENVTGDGPIVLSLPFQGIYDSTTGTCLQITRTAT